MANKFIKKLYNDEQIEKLLQTQVRYWRYDKVEDVYMNCWTVSGHKTWGIYPKPEFKTRSEAVVFFKKYLITHFYAKTPDTPSPEGQNVLPTVRQED